MRQGGGWGIRSALAALVAALALALTPAAARAAVHEVDFDGYAAGTAITDQYEPDGVRFADGPGQQAGDVPAIVPPPGSSTAPPGVLGGFTACVGSGEFAYCAVDLWMEFGVAQRSIVMAIGHRRSTLHGFRVSADFHALDGSLLGTADVEVPAAAGLSQHTFRNPNYFPCPSDPCDTSDVGSGEAFYVHLRAYGDYDAVREIVLDDLRFRAAPGPPPGQFAIQRDPAETTFGDEVGIRVGGHRDVRILINRVGAVGAVDFTVEAPGWLNASVDRSSTRGDAVALKLHAADPNAPPVDRAPVIVRARRATDPPNVPPKTLVVPVTLTREYDVQSLGMIVLQGPQMRRALTLAAVDGRSSAYQGVRLAGGGRTVVAVYANALTAPPNGVRASASLTALDAAGKPLSGVKTGMIFARGGSRVLTPAYPNVESLGDAYLFELPKDWTTPTGGALRRELRLKARLHGPGEGVQTFNPDPLRQCGTPQCLANDSLETTNVVFERMGPDVLFRWYDLYWIFNGQAGIPFNANVFLDSMFESLLPHREGGVRVLQASQGLDVSGVVASYGGCNVDPEDVEDCRSSLQVELANEVDEYDWDNPTAPFALPIGLVGGGIINGVALPQGGCIDTEGLFNVTCLNPGVAAVDVNRPFTSVAHEMWHLLGEEHADTRCGGNSDGQDGSDYNSDGGWGTFEGRTLDRSHAFFTDPSYPSFRFVTPGWGAGQANAQLPAGLQGRLVDFMSYCATDVDGWVSVASWQRMFDRLVHKPAPASPARAARASAPAPAATGARAPQRRGSGLRVSGLVTPAGTTRITHVRPVDRLLRTPPTDSPMRLRATDARGATVADVPLALHFGHVDGSGPIAAFAAEIPMSAARAAQGGRGAPMRVEVVGPSGTMASRERSATVPRVSLVAPRAGSTVGRGRTVEVRWRAGDRDGGPFTTRIDYSRDGGRTWRTIRELVKEPALDDGVRRVRLPSRLLSRSRNARLRVRVDDGFSEGRATSARFVSLGRSPRVEIASPARGERTRNETAVTLSGSALDDRDRPVGRLEWFAGKRRVATGPVASVVGLPAGRRVRIRLVATDRFGRRGSARVTIRVDGAAPRVVRLAAPESVGRRARTARIRLAASIPSKLTVSGRGARRLTASAGFRTRTYAVRLTRRAPGTIVLRLRLVSGRRSSTILVPVRRR